MHLVRALARPPTALPIRGARALSTSAAAHTSADGFKTSNGAWFLERGIRPPHRFEELYDFLDQDVPETIHEDIDRTRILATYARVVENELPRLSEFASEFRPPAKMDFLRLRHYHLQGQRNEPDVLKARLEFPVDKVFASGILPTKQARKKFLQLAGQRWDPSRTDRLDNEPGAEKPPRRSLARMSWDEVLEKGLGWVKITCVRFPNKNQNIKWVFDRFDEMVEEANREPYFDEVPLNVRHVLISQGKKAKIHRANGPSFRGFPSVWLPKKPSASALGGFSNADELTAEPWKKNFNIEEHDTVAPNVLSAGRLGLPVGSTASAQAARALAAKKHLPWTAEEYRARLPGTDAVSAAGGRRSSFGSSTLQSPPQQMVLDAAAPDAFSAPSPSPVPGQEGHPSFAPGPTSAPNAETKLDVSQESAPEPQEQLPEEK